MTPLRLLLLPLLVCSLSAGASAVEVDLGDLHLDTSAELRSLFTFTRAVNAEHLFLEGSTHRHDSGLSLTRLRLEGTASYKARLYGQLVYQNEIRTGSAESWNSPPMQ